MDSSEEELPDVVLKSPKKKASKSKFCVPDASILAAQRKIEDEKDELITKMIERSFSGISSDMNHLDSGRSFLASFSSPNVSTSKHSSMETSSFAIEDADKIAAERIIEKEKDQIIEDLMNNKTYENSDPEIFSCIDALHSNDGLITIPGENPGVDMSSFDYNCLVDTPCRKTMHFIQGFFEEVYGGDEMMKEKLISNLLQILYEMYSYDEAPTRLDDLLCHTFTVCGIILDRQCRRILTRMCPGDVLSKILKRVPAIKSQSDKLDIFSKLILNSFTNYHDRLYLIEHFCIKCRPSEIETNNKYFPTKLSKDILFKTLHSLVKLSKSSVSSCDSFKDLRKILQYGENMNKLTPYEQYLLLKICNNFFWMLTPSDAKTSKQDRAKSWIIQFFNGLKCNTKDQKSADFYKVKSLASKMKLLWQMDNDD